MKLDSSKTSTGTTLPLHLMRANADCTPETQQVFHPQGHRIALILIFKKDRNDALFVPTTI